MHDHLIRYDDFSAHSCTEVEERLIGLLGQQRVPCTFSVIPYVCDPDSFLAGEVALRPLPKAKANLLQPLLKEGLAEVALHGYSHLALAPIRGHQEFSQRMSKEVQRKLIRRGKACLEDVFGCEVRLYVPPWNRLAPSTAAVLREEGFILSGDIPRTLDSECLELAQLPCDVSIAQTSRALATAQLFGGRHIVGTIVHDYDFRESNLGLPDAITVAQFEALLIQWKEAKHVARSLVSNAIRKETESSLRLRANYNLKTAVNRSLIGRKCFSRVRNVYWSASTASRLERFTKYLL